MKKQLRIANILTILSSVICCHKKRNATDNEIYSQIVQEIIDSCTIVPPPPPFNSTVAKIEYKKQLKGVFNRKLVIAVYDTIQSYDRTQFKKLHKNSKSNTKWNDSDRKKQLVDLTGYKIKPNITLLKASELPALYQFNREEKAWQNYEELKNLYVALDLRRIILKKNKSEGFLQIEIICGKWEKNKSFSLPKSLQ
ncbi:hypothetical protein [Chryseobacterium wangxinyae]|uniref:hypothetical protein n=1 Tax=Chryseobacterium sp. CY353 TaxID=2997334 RepID=UPI00226F40DC|nr:hypothetical protein [Chryseobacterium sp. CY353]MCY0970865.1 hypothetical protein [Chryseobacterium sp. CY353]